MTSINKIKAPTLPYSTQVTVGTSAAALPDQELLSGGAVLKADATNAGTVYIGTTSVTTSNGFALAAGESVPVSIKNLETIGAIASQASQKLHILGS